MNAFDPLITHSPSCEHGPGARGAGVGAAVGLGQPEPAEGPAGDEIGQPLRLLIVVAELEDRVGAEADAGRQRDAHRLVDAAELLDRHAQRGEVATGAAVLARGTRCRTVRARPSPARRRPGSGARGPTAPRAARSPPRRTRAPCCAASRARRSVPMPSCDLPVSVHSPSMHLDQQLDPARPRPRQPRAPSATCTVERRRQRVLHLHRLDDRHRLARVTMSPTPTGTAITVPGIGLRSSPPLVRRAARHRHRAARPRRSSSLATASRRTSSCRRSMPPTWKTRPSIVTRRAAVDRRHRLRPPGGSAPPGSCDRPRRAARDRARPAPRPARARRRRARAESPPVRRVATPPSCSHGIGRRPAIARSGAIAAATSTASGAGAIARVRRACARRARCRARPTARRGRRAGGAGTRCWSSRRARPCRPARGRVGASASARSSPQAITLASIGS